MTPDDENRTPGTPPPGSPPPYAAGMSEAEIDDALERNRPAVSSGAARLLVYSFAALSLIVTVLYFLLYGGSSKQNAQKSQIQAAQPVGIVPPPAPAAIQQPTPPPAPPAPPEPPAPPPPPPPPAETTPTAETPSTLPSVTPEKTINFGDQNTQHRLRSGMMVVEGGANAAQTAATQKARADLASSDSNRSFSDRVLSVGVDKTTATTLTNLDRTIAQGKIIEAVLESAVDTDLPTPIRAIVSRDVYAESGRSVMIPKGSRLIGEYNTDVLRGQARIFIVWTRILEPDGTDVAIGSPAVDALGRAGINAHVDNKFMSLFSTAVLNTVLSIGTAVAVNGLAHGANTTTSTGPYGTTTTGSAGALAAQNSLSQFGSATQGILQDLIDIRPTLTIDQGTRVNVFVNRDVYFPESGGSALFLQ